MNILELLSNDNFIGAILSVIVFIIIGYLIEKKGIVSDSSKKTLTFLVLNIGLPCMVFKSFMTDFDIEVFKTDFVVLVLALIGYILLLVIGNLIFCKYDKEKRKEYAIMMTLGQVSLFSMPIIDAIYKNNEALIPINIVSIIFRIFLYGYSFAVFSNVNNQKTSFLSNVKRIFINPIVIAMILGIIIWSTQNIILINSTSILRVDITLPYVYKVITYASNITTPLSMILIGVSIGKFNIKDTLTSKRSYLISIFRALVSPLLMFLLIVITKEVFNIQLDEYQVAGILFAFGAPVSAVVNTYAIRFQKEEFVCGSACFISTLLSIIIFPLIYILICLYV